MKRKDTKITKTTTTTATTTTTHSIQGKAAMKQVFKFIVRHYYSLIRLKLLVLFLSVVLFLHAHSSKRMWWVRVRYNFFSRRTSRAHLIERVSIVDPIPKKNVLFTHCRQANNNNNKNRETKNKCVTDEIQNEKKKRKTTMKNINNIGIIIKCIKQITFVRFIYVPNFKLCIYVVCTVHGILNFAWKLSLWNWDASIVVRSYIIGNCQQLQFLYCVFDRKCCRHAQCANLNFFYSPLRVACMHCDCIALYCIAYIHCSPSQLLMNIHSCANVQWFTNLK